MNFKGRGDREMGRGAKIALCLFLVALSLPVCAQRQLRRPARVLGGGLGVRGAQALPPVLRRAIAASKTLRYTGRRIVTVMKDGQPDSHEEIVVRDGLRTRIEFPPGGTYSGQVIVENANERRHFLPDSNEVRVLPARGEEGLQRLRALFRQGGVALEEGERIAGYPTVEVTARDISGNLLQRLAIEPESGVVLRRRVYSATGTEAGGYVFTKVDLTPAPFDPSLFKIERRGVQVVTPYDQLRDLAKRSGYLPVSLPASSGFRLDRARVVKVDGSKVLFQNYIGPGGRLSLYELQAAVSPVRLQRVGKGARLQSVSWSAAGITFVLLGPQNVTKLQQLKDQVR